jgi:hypothetical protein
MDNQWTDILRRVQHGCGSLSMVYVICDARQLIGHSGQFESLKCSDCRRYSAQRGCDGAKQISDRSTSCYQPAGLIPGYVPNTISREHTRAALTNSRILVRYRPTAVRRQEGREIKTRLGWQVRRKHARPTWSIVELMGRTDPCRRERATVCRLAGKGSGVQRLGMPKFGLMESVSGH